MQSAHDDHREESTREIIGGTSCIPQKIQFLQFINSIIVMFYNDLKIKISKSLIA